MRVAVVGSRGIDNIDLSVYIDEIPDLIVSGGAKGMDQVAERWAKIKGIETLIFKPEYEKFGRGAPLRRNATIVDNSDIVYAFWDGISKGTKHTIDYAKKVGKKVRVFIIGQ